MLDDNFDSIGYTTVFSSGNLIYKGFLNFGLLNGEGIIQNIQNEILYQGSFIHNQKHGDGIITLNQQNYQGCFRKDYMDGIFRIQNDLNQQILYFCRDIQVEKQNFEKSNNYTIQSDKGLQIIQKNSQNNDVTLSISQYLNFEISIFSYKALSPGQWLFETQVDYFLAYFLNYFAMFSKLEQTIIFNTNESSDYICCDENQEFQINEMLYQKLDQSKKDKKRKVFVMNSQRSHFMIMIEDNKKLYCCDSLYKVNKNLENAFYNLLKIQDRNCYALKCTQQKNGYDCGIYSLYYAIQFMKYDNLSMVDLEMKLCLRNPSQFRWNLKQLVKQNHDYLLTNI
ncbi:unnamed protein product [Paramecium sonneborni]|uniref:Ubiquitin-like protease family profile domain-containing protein n=1 Tax=Paramecium sonneborni TaxID=65129 RepID=A0A8S1KS20_9CILI|nr:unnamed protein product [Paramecium sonneborni]